MSKKMFHKQDSLEKFLRYVLGCRPDEFGLHPDENGYIPLKSLLAGLHDEEGWRGVREGQITMLANQPGDLSPFEIEEGLIRLKTNLSSLPPEKPEASSIPKMLYLPLKAAAWAVIYERGLFPKTGDNVIRLWSEQELAGRLGRRLGAGAVVVTIKTGPALKTGSIFTPWSELLWLTESVAKDCLTGPPVPPRAELSEKRSSKDKEKNKPQEKENLAGSFHIKAPDPEVHRGKKQGKHSDNPDWKNQTRRDRRRHENDHEDF